MEAILVEVYGRHHGTKALAILEKRLGMPRWSIKRRAVLLGAATTRRKDPPWTEEEMAILRDCAWMVPERIRVRLKAAGFTRTLTAVAVQRKRSRAADSVDGTSARGLADLLGCDVGTVLRWIKRGYLRARRTGSDRYPHFIPTDAVRDFLVAHPEQVDLGKAERAGSKLWIVDLLSGGARGQAEAPAGVAEESPLADEAAHAAAQRAAQESAAAALSDLLRARGVPARELARRLGVPLRDLEAVLGGADAPVSLLASAALELGARLRISVDAGGAGE